MAAVELLFSQGPLSGAAVNLVFGDADSVIVREVTELTVGGYLPQPGLTGRIVIGPVVALSLHGLLPEVPLTAAFDAQYLTNTARPTVGQVAAVAQVAQPVESGIAHSQQDTRRTNTGATSGFSDGVAAGSVMHVAFTDAARMAQSKASGFQDGVQISRASVNNFQEGSPDRREAITGRFEDGLRAQAPRVQGRFQDGIHDRRPQVSTRWQQGVGHRFGYQGKAGPARPRPAYLAARFQEGVPPPPGVHALIVVPPGMTPPSRNLLFECPPASRHLLFGVQACYVTPDVPGQVVVPIRKVYMVINNASLRRVDGNIQLPVFNMSLALDVDSWTWNFSAALPGQALPNLEPDYAGAPVEVEALINGVPYRAVVESIGRSREFGKSDLRVQGRGKTALLDSPYAPTRNFTNPGDRTAQQIMGDVLSVNGVPMDWGIDWNLDDWLVPAGVFSHQGSYISAINAIAAAAGGYVQPHASLQSLSVLPRYAVAPWDWASITPDFDLPSDVTTREGIEWVERARYNRVFVSGQQSGVLGQVTRAGTAGDLVAPMVTDSLITTAGVARQRGMSILANTGRQAEVTLRLPVLAETGVITPGKFVQYTDAGVVRRGVVRSVAVEVGMPEIWQSIGVETHA